MRRLYKNRRHTRLRRRVVSRKAIINPTVNNEKSRSYMYLIGLRCLEAAAATTALLAVGLWWIYERPAIKEQRNLYIEQIEIIKLEQYQRNKKVVLDKNAYTEDRHEAFELLARTGKIKNIDFSIAGLDAQQFFFNCSPNLEFYNVNFSNLDLKNTCFKDSKFVDVNFEGADLTNADLSGAYIERLDYLYSTTITNTNFSGLTSSGPLAATKTFGECWVWETKKSILPHKPLSSILNCREINSELRPYWERLNKYYYGYNWPDGPALPEWKMQQEKKAEEEMSRVMHKPDKEQSSPLYAFVKIGLIVYEADPNAPPIYSISDMPRQAIELFNIKREALRTRSDLVVMSPQKSEFKEVDTALYAYQKLGYTYSVLGEQYVPRHTPRYDERGFASWYGPKVNGRRTANGEIFNMDALTAAHKTLPLNSNVYVTNLQTGKAILVRINDRGPFSKEYIIDLSKAAAEELEIIGFTKAKVRVRYAGPSRQFSKAVSADIRQ